MAAVVPYQKIMDLVDSDEELKSREKENKRLKEKDGDSGVSAASHAMKDSENEGITKEEIV